MDAFAKNLDTYAEIAVKIGLNVQKGQTLVIASPISCADFVRKVTVKAYEAGVHDVIVDWDDDQFKAIRLRHAEDSALEEYPMWKAKGLEELAAKGAAFLSVYAPNADLMKGIDPARIAKSSKAAAAAREGFLKYLRNTQVNWLLVSIPTAEWSAKVFPGLEEEDRVARLWEQIFRLTRVYEDDPVAAWKTHISSLTERSALLNGKKYAKLLLTGPGTHLTVELPERHTWVGAGSTTDSGIFFVPNMPTEEIFTMPRKLGVNGTVTSTMPLSYNGSLIDKFSLTFEQGKVVHATAETGEEVLHKMLDMDEGARYLGEIALVPHDSPISNSGITYYNTLFDENASCHIALGNSYPFCLEGGTAMNEKELTANGYNKSLIHVDFMIGSSQLDIDGITADGVSEPVFRQGNWV